MTDDFVPDEDVSYEAFDDAPWTDSGDLAPIDLDALDDALEKENPPSESAASLLKTVETLDDEIAPPPKPSTRRKGGAGRRASPAAKAVPAAPDPAPEPAAEVEVAAQPGKEEEAGAELTPEAVPDPPAPVEAAETSAPPAEAPAVEASAPPAESAAAAAPSPAAESAPAEEVPASEGEAPALPPTIYQVYLALPPELVAQLRELRKNGQISAMPPPGVLLVEGFRAAEVEPVKQALEKWARAHLPMQLETTAVVAEVLGEAQFVAAWALRPEKELSKAQAALRAALEPLTVPLPDMTPVRQVRVTVGDRVAPKRFPQVIAQMQRQFEPVVWHGAALVLAQREPDAGQETWVTAATYD